MNNRSWKYKPLWTPPLPYFGWLVQKCAAPPRSCSYRSLKNNIHMHSDDITWAQICVSLELDNAVGKYSIILDCLCVALEAFSSTCSCSSSQLYKKLSDFFLKSCKGNWKQLQNSHATLLRKEYTVEICWRRCCLVADWALRVLSCSILQRLTQTLST